MGRAPRIHYEGAVQHIVHRGNYRQTIFHDDLDRRRYLRLLARHVPKHDARLLAFCLMDNHVHLVIQVAATRASRIMLVLGSSYARYLHGRLGRTGHLFQGRYFSALVQDDVHLLEVVRYIDLNPVRAGLVTLPELYPWSSHRAYLARQTCEFLDTGLVLSLFGPHPAPAREAYARFVNRDMPPGGEAVLDPAAGEVAPSEPPHGKAGRPEWDTLLQVVGEVYGCPPEQLLSPGMDHRRAEARAVAAHLAREAGLMNLSEFARLSGRSLAVVSRSVGRLRREVPCDPALADRIARITEKLKC